MDFLGQLPPQLPPVAFDVSDPALWTDAVRSLKTPAARGVDAISAWEFKRMPFQAIMDIKKVLIS